MEGIEKPQPANNPFDKWKRDAEYENQAICKHLGIEYHKEDFTVSDKELARNWAHGIARRIILDNSGQGYSIDALPGLLK